MNGILALTLVAVLAAYINAQAPPNAAQQCAIPTNITFCVPYVSYPVLNASLSTWASYDSSANSAYTTAISTFTNASVGCQTALATYYCQVYFPRCTTYTNFNGIAQSRCDAVNSYCGITGFPSNFTGPSCIVNTQASVDGKAICAPTTTVSLGAACNGYVFSQNYSPINGTFQNFVCPVNSLCNIINANQGTCIKPNNLGDSCNGTCYNGPLMGTTVLTCIQGTCQYTGKRFGYNCSSNAECLSNNCTSGNCWESPLNGYCTGSNQCRQNLYCDTFNNTCLPVAIAGEYCGQIQSNWSPVPCAFGYTCIRGSGNQSLSTCQPNAVIGGSCSPNTGAIVYDSPLCVAPIVGTGTYTCVSGICTNVQPAALGQACNSTLTCSSQFTCQYNGGTQGVCQNPSSVSCGSANGTPQCNTYQICNCGSSQGSLGTCSLSSNPYYVCASQFINLQNCLLTNCQSANSPFIFYDNYSCGSKQCLAQINALVCCAQNAAGPNFVPPNGTPANVCATPSPTPSPTTPTSTPTSSPTGIPTSSPTSTPTSSPTPTPKVSSGTTLSVSFFAIIMVLFAFCL
jgi:hypothetical protein